MHLRKAVLHLVSLGIRDHLPDSNYCTSLYCDFKECGTIETVDCFFISLRGVLSAVLDDPVLPLPILVIIFTITPAHCEIQEQFLLSHVLSFA